MKFKLSSRFFGALAAVAIAATAFSAAPVYADRDDQRAARAIATILGLAVVGKIIHDNNKNRSDKHKKAKKRSYEKNRGYDVKPYRANPRPRPLPKRIGRAPLPRECFRNFQTRRGQVYMFAQRCLERNYRATHRLPQSCAKRIRTHRGARYGFDARCLQRQGYQVSRR